MGATVAISDKTAEVKPRTGRAATEIRLLGPLAVARGGAPVELPPSRKARALLAYLALTPEPVSRPTLCDLLWDGADDPRGELRWCLSRVRAVLGETARLISHEDAVRLDGTGLVIDVTALESALADERVSELDAERCRTLLSLFGGDFLQGLELEGSPHFNAWLTAQRHRFRDRHVELLERLAIVGPDQESLQRLEEWRQLAPYDQKVHQRLLYALAGRGRVREAEEHLRAAVKLFEDEGLDCAPLHAAWLDARSAPGRLPAAVASARSAPDLPGQATAAQAARRASIAVMPFADHGGAATPGGTADALAYDVITRLAKLRSLFVIAQGTVFELRSRGLSTADAARMLNVDYVIDGTVRRDGDALIVSVDLIEMHSGRVVWADVLKQPKVDALVVLDEIGNRIVASIASEVETLERNRAVLKAPSSLDAWESHHRGLWHMYRFSKTDNDQAQRFFQNAVHLDPTFSRAYAGLSFTHFQSAFQHWAERERATELAFEFAGQALMADDRDPAAHWAMGRALWLRTRQEQCIAELEQAVDLSPNFALAHYTLAFVQSQAGDPRAAIRASDYSRSLSPYDPLLFGMLGARAMALVRLGDYEEAAAFAVQAAGRPNAHVHIQAIAAFSLALAGSMKEAESYAAAVRKADASYTAADFFGAFRFDAHGIATFRKGARRLGMA